MEAEGIETKIVFAETLDLKNDDNYVKNLFLIRDLLEIRDDLKSWIPLVIVNPTITKDQCIEFGVMRQKRMRRDVEILFLEDTPNGN